MKLIEILQTRTVSELKEQCMQYQLSRYSKLKKLELAQLLADTMLLDAFLENFFLAIDNASFRSFEKLLKGKKNYPVYDLSPFLMAGYMIKQEDGTIQIAEELQSFDYKRFDGAFYKYRKQIQKFREYFNAFVSLYGIIPIDKLLSLMSEYEAQPITEHDFFDAYKILSTTQQFFYYLDNALVAEALFLDKEDYMNTRQAQVGKPYAHLPKNEFLKYADDQYIEKTPQYFAIAQFLQKTFRVSVKRGEALARDIAGLCQVEASFDVILSYLDNIGVRFDEEQLFPFMSLYTDLQNHTRIWSNCGNTPAMLYYGTK